MHNKISRTRFLQFHINIIRRTLRHSSLPIQNMNPLPRHYLILTDSLSSLTTIQNHNTNNPIIRRILLTLQPLLLPLITMLTFICIPSHYNIPGYEKTDKTAEDTSLPLIFPPIIIQYPPTLNPSYVLKF